MSTIKTRVNTQSVAWQLEGAALERNMMRNGALISRYNFDYMVDFYRPRGQRVEMRNRHRYYMRRAFEIRTRVPFADRTAFDLLDTD